MNIYRARFSATCPNNGVVIEYDLTLVASRVIMVEAIIDKLAEFQTGFHEDLADVLHSEFGGLQKLQGYHHGVEIITLRGVI